MQSLLRNEKFYGYYAIVKPVFTTYMFELKKQRIKFFAFSLVGIAFLFLLNYLPYLLIPENPLPVTQIEFFEIFIGLSTLLIIFGCCFFFAPIICNEFGKKMGYITFPIINKYKLIIGKYLGALTLMTGVLFIFYFSLAILGIYYYGLPVNIRYVYSFGICLLHMLAVSALITFFSSFMKNVNITIVTTLLLLLIGIGIVDTLIILYYRDFEPIYSLAHNRKLVSYIMEKDFPTTREERYEKIEARGFTWYNWYTPSIEMAITIFLTYTGVCLALASIIFSRRQL